jgi:hypothetical protein
MNCKHRWEPLVSVRSLNPNRYMYVCARCLSVIHTTLKETSE